MNWNFFKNWSRRRHLKKHERARKQVENRVRGLEEIKREAQKQLKELEDDEKLWNSVQLDEGSPGTR